MKVYLNGRIIEEDEALIPATDRGVLFGDGVFETMRAYQGKPFRLERHLERLRQGCRALRIQHWPADGEIADALTDLYYMNVGEGDAYMRITLTGGPFDGRRTLERPAAPNTLIVVKPLEPYPEEFYKSGMRLIVSGIRRNEGSFLSRVKSNNYLASLAAKQEAADRGADDAVMLNNGGLLAEGTSSNLFLVIRGKVCTPDEECGLLPGITREAVLELCGRLGIAHETGSYTLEDLMGADEAFLTASTGEILPVAEVEEKAIGLACPGLVTTRLTSAFRELVQDELRL